MVKTANLKLEKVSKFVYKAFTLNNKYLGTFELDVDGNYHYWQDKSLNGAWSAYQLKAIADKLDEINKPYKETVDEYFNQERRDREERARVEYRKLLVEGNTLRLIYPHLTGDWKKDRLEWFVIHADLEDLRAKNSSF